MDIDDWGQIPLTDEVFDFTPETDHSRGYILGPRDCGKNFRLFLEASPTYVDPMSSLLGGYYTILNNHLTQWDPERYWHHLVEGHRKYKLVHGIEYNQHFLPDIDIGLTLGFEGLLKKIKKYRKINLKEEQQAYYDGLTDFVNGIQHWIANHIATAKKMAEKEKNTVLRKNLKEMIDINTRILSKPPDTFRAALQWLAWYQMAKRVYIGGGSLGRIDQSLYPYYKREHAAGVLNEEEAIFHLACFLIKDSAYIQVGGVDENGKDVTNDVSFMVLEAARRIKIPCNICVVVHEDMDKRLMRKAVELLVKGKMGTPRFSGLKSQVNGFQKNGFTRKQGYMRVQAGCHWFCLPGTEYGYCDLIKINLAKVLEVAFYEMMSNGGKRPSVQRLWKLYLRHLGKAVDIIAQGIDFHFKYHHRFYPELALSILCHGPVEKGVDASHGGVDYMNFGVDGAALATVADSFAAMEVRIEQENKVSWNELLAAMVANWYKYSKVHSLMQSVPAYGRGNTRGDYWADRISKAFTRIVRNKPTPMGLKMTPGFFSWASTLLMGKETGATPDGRASGDPISFGANPNPGRLRGGSLVPTTMSSAIARIQPGYGNPAPFQFDIDPGLFNTEESISKFEALIRAHFEIGGTLINANILDKEQILDAYHHPEKYPELIVRVTGFSAYFSSLSDEFRKLVYDRILSLSEQ
jgi:formate C-acetyltransferase